MAGIDTLGERLFRAVGQRLAEPSNRLTTLGHRLQQSHPGVQLRHSAQRLDELETRFGLALRQSLDERRSRLAESSARLRGASPAERIGNLDERLGFLFHSLARAARDALRKRGERLSLALRTLESVSPIATLERGYAIITSGDSGAIISDARSAPRGAGIDIRLARGGLSATVDESRPADTEQGDG